MSKWKILKEWMNKWVNEWMNDWMCKWMSEWDYLLNPFNQIEPSPYCAPGTYQAVCLINHIWRKDSRLSSGQE